MSIHYIVLAILYFCLNVECVNLSIIWCILIFKSGVRGITIQFIYIEFTTKVI